MEKIILHSDANCFYASVEMLHRPELAGKPLAVGGNPETRHGIVLTANYIAKRQGVKTGSALWQARQACPGLMIVPPDYGQYIRFSGYLREIYADYSDRVEAFGLDESWIDVTKSGGLRGSGMKIAEEIRQRVKDELGITVSVGMSWNKIFAKFGSDYKKPDAVTEISRENYKDILWTRPVSDLLYVGRATKRKLQNFGINTIGEIAQADPAFLRDVFGKMGLVLSVFASGEDQTPVAEMGTEAAVKSIGNSMTMPRDLTTDEEMRMAFYMLSESVAARLRESHFKGDVISIWVRNNELLGLQRQHKIAVPTNISDEIAREAYRLFREHYHWERPVRAVGVKVEGLRDENCAYQTDLFLSETMREKQLAVDCAVDEIRRRYGDDAVRRGLMHFGPKISAQKFAEQGIHPLSYFDRGNQTGIERLAL